MNSREEQQLEDFIHAQLQKLPEREAPDCLVLNVMTALASRKELPWYKQPWSEWPRLNQAFFLGLLLALTGLLIRVAGPLTESISLAALMKKASGFAWVWEVFSSFAGAIVLALGTLSWQWFAGLAVAVILMYLACIGTGMALYRVTTLDNRSAL